MRPSEVVACPPPPSGLPPPRPPGLHRAEEVRPRNAGVRFESKANIRSLSLDVRRTSAEGEAEAGEDQEGSAQQSKGHNILVAVRCRALLPQEMQAGGRATVKVTDGQTVVLEDPKTTADDDYLRINKSKERRYNFDQAFDPTARNHEVYERTTRFLIGSVLQGFNATVFAYGATSAGKTHTMLGYAGEPGIMMLTLQDLFEEVSKQTWQENKHIEVKCSFLEVYNENIRDLLSPESDFLDIREDPVKGMCVAGISEVGGLESAGEIMALLQQANKHRTTESTGANVTSSRSHAVLQVMVHQRDASADVVAQVNLGKLSMIDLAGSERASHTNNKGLRMIEGANINRSLLALGNCITALSSSVAFVPYRDSKMTRLLKDSLGGNCRTVMIANVSPCHINYEDTHNTLKYANRAKNIKTKSVRNVVTVNYHASKYTEIIKDLRSEISDLKTKLAGTPAPGGMSILSEAVPSDGEDADGQGQEILCWKQELMTNFEERVRIKRRLIDLAHETKNQMVQKSHAQVGISQWESAQQASPEGGVDTPASIRDKQELLKLIKTELAKTEVKTGDLEGMLHENQEKAEHLQADLPRRVKNKDMQAFFGLVSRIYVMEVENMDIQEMNDVTAPLLEQKDLEAEALRLQISLRDRMIEEQDQMLLGEDQATLPKPEGWISIPPKPNRRMSSPARWSEEDDVGGGSGTEDQSPQRKSRDLGRGYSGLSIPSEEKLIGIGGALQPAVGIGGSRARASSEGIRQTSGVAVLPPLSPTRGRPDLSAVRERRNKPSSQSPAAGVRPPSASGAGESASEASARNLKLLDVSGRALGFPPRPYPPPTVTPTSAEMEARPVAMAIALAMGNDPLWQDGGRDPDSPKSPKRSHVTSTVSKRKGSKGKKTRRGEGSARGERKPVQLHVEAKRAVTEGSVFRREQDDGSSGSERDGNTPPPARNSARGDPVTAAAERRGIILKLNRRMKPSGSENAAATPPKSVY